MQEILADPERVARRPKPRYSYPLRGRIKCGICSSAMVGQTMQGKTSPFHYYAYRVAFGRRPGKACSARNGRADKLEAAIRDSEQRLVRLYTSDRIDDAMFGAESAVLKRECQIIDDRLRLLRPSVPATTRGIDSAELEQVYAKIDAWLDGASE